MLDGELLETTPEHPFYTLERGWVDAGDLWVGAHIRQADGSYGRVQFLTVEREDQVMYNLTVDEAHTFFVGAQRWLVHNCARPAISFQKGGGGAGQDFLRKGLYFNYGPGEFGFKATLQNDGVIELKIINVGKKQLAPPTAKEVDKFLRDNREDVLIYLGKALDNRKVAGQPRHLQPDKVIEGRLIGRALQGKNPYVIVD